MLAALLAISLAAVALFGGMVAHEARAGVYNMELAGKHVAYVKNPHTVEAAMDLAKREVEKKTGRKPIGPVEAPVLNKLDSDQVKPLPMRDLAARLETEVDWKVPVWQVYGLGGTNLPMASKADAEAVLAAIKAKGEARSYPEAPADGKVPRPSMDTAAELANLDLVAEAKPALAPTRFKVLWRGLETEAGMNEGEAPLSAILTKEEALAKIAAGRPVHHVHEVHLGEDLESIARAWQMDPAAVKDLNPSLDWGFVIPGTGVHVERMEPLIGDRVVLRERAQVYTPFEIVYEDDPDLLVGQFKVKTKGKPGVKTVVSKVERISDFETARQLESETFDSAPEAAVVLRGTGDPKRLSGKVDWPITGPITSPFGERNWEDHVQEFHRGIDIAAPTGTPVGAAKGGKVFFAGEMGTYGNVVFVDHGNGLTTRYAHLSAISVEVGAELTRGDTLGLVGSTGNSTGPHLHFEVLINEEPKDPMLFLEGKGNDA